MIGGRWLFFGAGVVVGVVGARMFLAHPEGRRVAKAAVKSGLSVTDWVARQAALLKEDVSDLVAEARVEREGAGESGGETS